MKNKLMFVLFNVGLLFVIFFSINMSMNHKDIVPFIWYVLAIWTILCLFIDRVLLRK